MLARIQRRNSASGPKPGTVDSLRRTSTGGSLRLGGTRRQVETARRDQGEEAVLSTVSTALGLLRDVAGALQNIPYVGAVAVATVRVLEIREVSFYIYPAAQVIHPKISLRK
jgi:hypothetical protein